MCEDKKTVMTAVEIRNRLIKERFKTKDNINMGMKKEIARIMTMAE